MLKVPGNTSANTGVIPSSATTSTVATKVKEQVISSSPAFRPSAIIAICKASVPLAQPMVCFTPRYALSSFSNSFTSGPLMKAVLSITRRWAASTSSLIFRYWPTRSTIWMGFIGVFVSTAAAVMGPKGGGEDSAAPTGALGNSRMEWHVDARLLSPPAMRCILALLLLWCFNTRLIAQGHMREDTLALVLVNMSYAYQVPGGDMAQRFGNNSNIGIGGLRKFKSNYMLGIEGGFMFGNQVIEPGILRNVINSAGQVLDEEGVMADVFLYERGWSIFGFGGKLLPVIGPNPNSGLLLKVGAGYLRHKVRVQTQKNVVPQLEDEYLEGYDRLCAGPAALGYIGYQHLSNRGRVNFHVGVELTAGFTQALHPYNFDTESYNTPNRVDLLTGLRVGWSLPIYRKLDDRFRY